MKATIYFPPADLQRDAWFASGHAAVIAAFRAGRAITGPTIELATNDQDDIMEEAYDLSNNPSRQDERDEKYGQFRSVSVGDIVAIEGGSTVMCKNIGWEEI